MNKIQLLLRSVLYRKSQRSLADELSIPKTTLNRVLNGCGSINEINLDAIKEAYCAYPMPEGLTPESTIQVNIPFAQREEQEELMETLRTAFQGKPLETSFRIQEIRKLIIDGADYSDGLVFINETSINSAKQRLEEFKTFKQQQGIISAKHEFWIRHTAETINILETAYYSDFLEDKTALKSGVELVFDLKKAIDSRKLSRDEKLALEFLLITSATQTAEISYSGGNQEIIPEISNIIANTFGKYAESSFQLLILASAWEHNQQGLKKLHEQNGFDSNNVNIKGLSLDLRENQILASIQENHNLKEA